jgi:hypothetical protein
MTRSDTEQKKCKRSGYLQYREYALNRPLAHYGPRRVVGAGHSQPGTLLLASQHTIINSKRHVLVPPVTSTER